MATYSPRLIKQRHLRWMRCSQKKIQSIKRRMQRANDFGYMLATHDKAPEGLYNLLALASGVPDGFRTRNLLSHSQALCH
jgi:hypothetical protein